MESTLPVSAHRNRVVTRFYLSVILFFIGLSILCQFVAFIMPGWLVVDMTVFQASNVTQNYALWYVEVCTMPHRSQLHFLEKKCTTRSYTERHVAGTEHENAVFSFDHTLIQDHSRLLWMTYYDIVEWQICVTLALFCTFLSTFLLCVQRHRISLLNQGVTSKLPTRWRFVMALVLTLISDAALIIAVCNHVALRFRLDESRKPIRTHTPYSLIVEAVGIVPLLIAAMMVAPVCKGDPSSPRIEFDASVHGQRLVPLVANQSTDVERLVSDNGDNAQFTMQGASAQAVTNGSYIGHGDGNIPGIECDASLQLMVALPERQSANMEEQCDTAQILAMQEARAQGVADDNHISYGNVVPNDYLNYPDDPPTYDECVNTMPTR